MTTKLKHIKCNLCLIFVVHMDHHYGGPEALLTHVLRVKYRQKYLFDNKSRFLSVCFDLGWKASDKSHYGKGLACTRMM